MTKDEKSRFLERLRGCDLKRAGGYDRRLFEYFEDVVNCSEWHNGYEVAGCVRFFEFLDRYDFRWEKVLRFVRLYESLLFPGNSGRQRYRLTPIQVFQFASIFGFYREDGRRLTRRAILYIPRKFSKTTMVASVAVHELLYGDQNAQAYAAANSYKQAQVCFREISQLCRQLDSRGRFFQRNRETIRWKENKFGKESYVECLSGGADTKDGLNASLVIFDEYAAAKYVKGHSDGAELLQVLESSSGSREDYLTLIITTASRVLDGPFMSELGVAEMVLEGKTKNDSLFASLFMPDEWEVDDFELLGDRRLWKKCNPHIGVSVKESFYQDMFELAKTDPEKMIEFKTKMLNIPVAGGGKMWFDFIATERLMCDFYPGVSGSRLPAMCAIDLSVRDDLSSVTYGVYSRKERKFYFYSDFYVPQAVLGCHENARLYQQWVDDGFLKVCPGNVIDYAMIVDDILKRNKQMKILQIGFDAYKAKEVVNSLSSAIMSTGTDPKKILKAVPQTFGAFTAPVDSLTYAAFSTVPKVGFARNPIMRWMLCNAVLEEDRMGNRKPMKSKANLKIDGVVTSLMCIWLFQNFDRGAID